jgi:spore maturation protein SpmB
VVSGAHFDWSEVLAAGGSMSLFAERQILEIRVPTGKPGKEGSPMIQQLAQSAEGNDSTLTLFVLPRLDSATKKGAWFGALEQFGVSLQIDSLDRAQLPQWIAQRLKLLDPVVLRFLLGAGLLLGVTMAVLASLSSVALAALSSVLGNAVVFGLIVAFLLVGVGRRVPVYEAFVDGAREGFEVAKNLLPYLVAMLCAVGVLRASGALDFLLQIIRVGVEHLGWDQRFVDALPTALVKPFSGSAARAMLIETMSSQGVDSFPALLAATVQGSTETTFYVLAVYFGAVGIQRARHAVACALLADLAGVVASIAVCYWFFG